MAFDDTRPKVRMLFTIGVVAVCLLLGMKFVLDSYYLDMTEAYEHKILPKPELRDETKKTQLADIDDGKNGAIPVSVAMQLLETKGRENASTDITPEQSADVDPLKGWTKLKHTLHLPPQAADETADAGAAPTLAGDAGAHPAAIGDAGVQVHPAPPTHPAPHSPKDGGK